MGSILSIHFPRGDLIVIPFTVTSDNGEPYTEELSEIYFTVKRNYRDRKIWMQKTLTGGGITYAGDGEYRLHINPEDTDSMDFGEYDFDFEVIAPGIKQTTRGKMELTSEVTHASDE